MILVFTWAIFLHALLQIQPTPLLASIVKHFSVGAEAALGLFNAALLSAAEQSSPGSSQVQKRLCTSASQEKESV